MRISAWLITVSMIVSGVNAAPDPPAHGPDDGDTASKFVHEATASYHELDMHGFRVMVSSAALAHPATTDPALELLDAELAEVVQLIPLGAVATLRTVPVWMEHDNPGFPCACYHPDAGWLKGNGYNLEKEDGVEIANPVNFVAWVERTQPLMVLHELAHGYHDIAFGFDDPYIKHCYDLAVAAGTYESVAYVHGVEKRHYALNDQMEYFAELTEAYFGQNDFFPFQRDELREHDPVGYAMIEHVWGIAGEAADDVEVPNPDSFARSLPERGISAHRGAMSTNPENTLSAFREAIRLGVHQIELDVRLTRDGRLVLMHDDTVDRTTDGSGSVEQMTFAEIRQLDAGTWKDERFAGQRVPTLTEALRIMPRDLWVNVHLKGGGELGATAARVIVREHRVHQAFLACGVEAAEAARAVDPRVKICHMAGQHNSGMYIDAAKAGAADFVQFVSWGDPLTAAHIARAKDAGLRINYCCAAGPDELAPLMEMGVQFVLVDDPAAAMERARGLGIPARGK